MSDSQDQGSFLTGFTLGLFAGAAGYFMFATDKGQTVRKELAKEWASANKQGSGGVFSGQSLRQTVRDLVHSMSKNIADVSASPAKNRTSKSKTTARKSTKS